MWLGSLAVAPRAQLSGFKERTLKASAEGRARRVMFVTEWGASIHTDTTTGTWSMISATSSHLAHTEEMTARCACRQLSVLVLKVATLRAEDERQPLVAVELALVLAQVQAATFPSPTAWLITSGAQTSTRPQHAGAWGLGRTVRSETALAYQCIDGDLATAQTLGLSPVQPLAEPEAVLQQDLVFVPRLKSAPPSTAGLVRLHFHSRGAVTNLFCEPQPAMKASGVLLRVRAIGLNFRDVLNVLGEYPGDPGPPGSDSAGEVADAASQPAFGFCHAPLASMALALLVTPKPSTIDFEQASTLPTTWTTSHVALRRAALHAATTMLVQAASGGVGLKAIEYSQWLGAVSVGTAGGMPKHRVLRANGTSALLSSRYDTVFAMSASRLLRGKIKFHAVLNSLSFDFVPVSLALLGEGGAFDEIGKRSIWASGRHAVAAPATTYCVIAGDQDMDQEVACAHAMLKLLAVRASNLALTSLPISSFEMSSQHKLAFRLLQRGQNIGKVVLSLAALHTSRRRSAHVVTGGTGGLGLLVGWWLAQKGACQLLLASRGGKHAGDASAQWKDSFALATAERCDFCETIHVRRLFTLAPSIAGVWHAAGVLADATLPKQDAFRLVRVYAPKMYGGWALRATTLASDVDSFALFSSVTALLGDAGQANYGAANACLDALASWCLLRGAASTSVQWGAWAEVGMAVRGKARKRVERMEKSSGVAPISLALGLAALGEAVQPAAPSVICMLPVVWNRFLAGGVVPVLLSEVAPKASMAAQVNAETTNPVFAKGIDMVEVFEMAAGIAGGELTGVDQPVMESGVDSLGSVDLRNQLVGLVGEALPFTIIFDHPTVRQLTALVASTRLPCLQVDRKPLQSDGIARRIDESMAAVVGLSALFPSGASSARMASRLVVCSHDAIIEVPLARWDVNDRSDLSEPAASRVRHYGLVRNAELVDNAAFAVSPAETLAMDPQQRLLLEHCYAALHNAALAREQLDNSLTGVFVGYAGSEFDDILSASPAGATVYAATGSTPSIASGRLSYVLGLHGPCVTYDTACSAALAAGHGGLRALQRSECGDSLVAAIAFTLAPGVGIAYAIAGMTSARGRSHTFDARADGYVRAEACGAVALRLAYQACELSVGGSAVRQDGRSASLTAPNGQSQQRLLAAALVDAGTDVDELVLSEAHGTGTALGDPIEVRSLLEAVLKRRTVGALPVGGVKANIGHAEGAAGMTGLLRLALGLRQGLAAPNAQLRVLNPHVSTTLHNAACALPVHAGRVMRCGAAGVSSFGYSGTIAHAVLQGREDAVTPPTLPTPPQYKRHAFWWREAPHPFAQRRLASDKERDLVFHSPVIGALHTLVADHVVRGQVIFPGAGYLELACTMARRQGAMAKGVFFLKPLAIEVPVLLVEFAASNGEFEVRSGEAGGAWEVHCSGGLATSGVKWEHVDQVATRGSATSAATVDVLYDSFYSAGLQYGPGYRTLKQAWSADARAMSRLRVRLRWQGTAVHPADLDDALCTIPITTVGGGGDDEARLPFVVDDAMLVGGVGELWAVRHRHGFSSLPAHAERCVCACVHRWLRSQMPRRRRCGSGRLLSRHERSWAASRSVCCVPTRLKDTVSASNFGVISPPDRARHMLGPLSLTLSCKAGWILT